MGKYREQDYDITMGIIATGIKYLSILVNNNNTKAHIQEAGAVDTNNEPAVVGG